MLKPYDEYRKDNPKWMGDIPVTWDLYKIGEIFTERRTKVSDKDFEALSVCKAGVVPQLESAVKTDNGDNRKLVCIDDFAINSRSDRKGSGGVSKYNGSVSLIITVLKPKLKQNSDYINYLMRSVPFSEEFYRNGKGLVSDLWTTNYDAMKNIILPIPPIAEQKQIVSYLNWKTAQMDYFVQEKEREIINLKDLKIAFICDYSIRGINHNEFTKSDFPWINEYPITWRETRLKHILIKLKRSSSEDDELLICSNSGKVFPRGNMKLGLVSDNEKIYQGVRKGDLLIHGMDTWHGAIAVSEHDGKCTPVVHVCNSKENKKYIAYYLQALAYKKVYKLISNGVRENTSDFRSWNIAGNINVLVPPLDEQNKIVEILDEKCLEIEEAILNITKEIALVNELRTRTIADVVTGKVDVRNIPVPEQYKVV